MSKTACAGDAEGRQSPVEHDKSQTFEFMRIAEDEQLINAVETPPAILPLRFYVVAALLTVASLGWIVSCIRYISSPPGLRSASLSQAVGAWSIRSEDLEDRPVSAAECSVDISLSLSYLAEAGLDLRSATKACPAIDKLIDNRNIMLGGGRRLKQFGSPGRRRKKARLAHAQAEAAEKTSHKALLAANSSGLLPARSNLTILRRMQLLTKNRQSNVTDLESFSRRMFLPVWRQNSTVNATGETGLHEHSNSGVKERSLITNHLFDRETSEPLPFHEQIAKLNDAIQTDREACTADISGVVAGFAWAVGYMAAATSECAYKVYQQRFCASDIARIIAASGDLIQAISGILSVCEDKSQAIRMDPPEDFAARRLKQVGKLPADPVDQLLRNMEDTDDDDKDEREDKQAAEAECGVNIAMAVQFVGRAALEINGAVKHCPGKTELEERRCSVNAVGAFATFALMSHEISGAVKACEEANGVTNLDAACGVVSSQLIHALAELTAAAVAVSEECVPEATKHGYGRATQKELLDKSMAAEFDVKHSAA